jgi:hypothetical protein
MPPTRLSRFAAQATAGVMVLLTGGLRIVWILGCVNAARGETAAATPVAVSIGVDAAHPTGPLKPIWRFFGADEPNYATMPDGRKLLADIGRLRPRDTYFRAHNLLCTGDGTPALKWGSTNIYTEDTQGNPIYDWTIVDAIFDSYLTRGVRPFAQLGFMPRALSTQREGPYQHNWKPGVRYKDISTGWAHPMFLRWPALRATNSASWSGITTTTMSPGQMPTSVSTSLAFQPPPPAFACATSIVLFPENIQP